MNSIQRNIPNLLTGVRLLLIPLLLYLLYSGDFNWSLLLILVMGLTDALDGFIAKRLNCVSRFGEFFDPVCDKLMLVSVTVLLAYMGLLPLWLVALIIVRDLAIVVGGATYYYTIAPFRAAPSMWSKVNTFLQLLLVVIVIYSQIMFVPYAWLERLFYGVAITTALSGVGYVWTWGCAAILAKSDSQNLHKHLPRINAVLRAIGLTR